MPLQLTSDIERPSASEASASSDYECLGGTEICLSRDLERQVATVREIGVRGFPLQGYFTPGCDGIGVRKFEKLLCRHVVRRLPHLNKKTKRRHMFNMSLKPMNIKQNTCVTDPDTLFAPGP